MGQESEAFHPESYTEEETKPQKREAIILPFKQKTGEGKEGKKEQGYEGYKTLGGTLNQGEYDDVLKSVEEGRKFNPMWSEHANFMAKVAGITLSPETIAIYGILRDIKPDGEHYSKMPNGDHELLDEALRVVGDKASLDIFIESRKP